MCIRDRFSTNEAVRRTPARRSAVAQVSELPNDAISPLFVAVADATEEAIYNSLLKARTIESVGLDGKPVTGKALDAGAVKPRR